METVPRKYQIPKNLLGMVELVDNCILNCKFTRDKISRPSLQCLSNDNSSMQQTETMGETTAYLNVYMETFQLEEFDKQYSIGIQTSNSLLIVFYKYTCALCAFTE